MIEKPEYVGRCPLARAAGAWALSIALITGCSGPSQSPPSASASQAPQENVPIEERDMGDTLILSLDAEPAHLNSVLDTGDANTRYIDSFIFDTLLTVDRDTLDVKPRVATSWEISDDHKTYTFHLNEDAVFSDGIPLTARDIKFSWEMIMNPANDTAALRNYMQDIASIDVLDDHTIRFNMGRVYFRHIISLGTELQILPEHIYAGRDLNTHPNNRAPIGSGPYIFEKWDTGQQIILTRNENYWGTPQPIEKRIWKIIVDDNAAFQALERGDTDMYPVKPDDWLRKASRPEFEARFTKVTPDSPIPGFLSRLNYIGWNMRKEPFKDKRVRQALCMLFDRELIIETVWGGLGTIVTGDIYHKAPEYNQSVKPWPFDPERAARLLDEAGWIDSDKDGIRDKNGVKFSFELSYAANVQEYDRLGTVYQEELKRAGIEMKLNPLEWASFQERVQRRTFDACMLAWLLDVGPDPYQLWHSSQAEKGSNYPGLKNAEEDKILEDARQEFDQAKRIKLYHRHHEILHEEQPYLFLFARPGLLAVDKRFRGIIVHKGGLDPLEWWVPAALQKYP
jgi:peptide/nickel transport system substrate-binding protein